jgi:beta-galactosidase
MVNQAMNQAVGRSENLGLSWITGDGLWSMFDYQTWNDEPLTTSGAMDLFRIPKFTAYFYQSQRSPGDTLVPGVKGGPMVSIASWWTPTSPLTVKVFSNCDSVSLFLNGTQVGTTEAPGAGDTVVNLEHGFFTFKVPAFQKGTLSAKGKIGGVIVDSCQVSMPGTPKSISMAIDTAGLQLAADGSDIAIIYASVVDSMGTVVPTAVNPITFSITGGSGTLIGSNPMPAQAGIATILLRASTKAGPITVSTAGSGLSGTSGTVTTVAPSLVTGVAGHFASKTVSRSENFSIRRIGNLLCVYAPAQLVGGVSPAKFSLYNSQGRLIGRWDLAGGVTAVKMTSLPHGVYFGQITNNGGKFMQKVVW